MPSTTTSREWSNRRFGALLAAILWMIGFELVPSVHVGFHDWFGDHQHGAVAQHEHDHEADHVGHGHGHGHGHGAKAGHHHHADQPDPLDDEIEDDPTQSRVSTPGHGEHSLAHRGIAAIDPPPAQPRVMAAPLRLAAYILPAGQPPRNAQPTTVRSRGPPSA
jgi:hypothetical protein